MVDFARTPFSRARPRKLERDAFSDISGPKLVATTLNHMFDEKLEGKLNRSDVDQLILGNAFQVGHNASISGKFCLWLANFPDKVGSFLTERQCGSGMTALHQAFMSISMGYEDVIIASGFEHQTLEPMHNNRNMNLDMSVAHPWSKWYNQNLDVPTSLNMIQTAQKLYEQEINNFSREDLDAYGVRSHNLAETALNNGFFNEEIVPIVGHLEGDINGDYLVDHDLSIRKGATMEQMKNLPIISKPGWAGGYESPVLDKSAYKNKNGGDLNGVITPGNASPMNAGAASVLLVSKQALNKFNITPMCKIVEIGWASVDPTEMGRGPVPATERALKKAQLKVDDIDYWEINEAFCIVALSAIRDLKIKNADKKVNIHGGATAIGHPLSATGIRMPGTLARILKEENAKFGIANMGCGGGQGTSMIIENVELK